MNKKILSCVLVLVLFVVLAGGCIREDASQGNVNESAAGEQGTEVFAIENETKNKSFAGEKEPVSSKDYADVFCIHSSGNKADYENCYLWFKPLDEGVKKSGISYCASLEGKKTDCFGILALNKNDYSVCTEKLNGSESSDCVKMFAIANEDVSLCEKIDYSTINAECIIAISVIKNDVSLCEKIESELMKKVCVSSVSGGGKESIVVL